MINIRNAIFNIILNMNLNKYKTIECEQDLYYDFFETIHDCTSKNFYYIDNGVRCSLCKEASNIVDIFLDKNKLQDKKNAKIEEVKCNYSCAENSVFIKVNGYYEKFSGKTNKSGCDVIKEIFDRVGKIEKNRQFLQLCNNKKSLFAKQGLESRLNEDFDNLKSSLQDHHSTLKIAKDKLIDIINNCSNIEDLDKISTSSVTLWESDQLRKTVVDFLSDRFSKFEYAFNKNYVDVLEN